MTINIAQAKQKKLQNPFLPVIKRFFRNLHSYYVLKFCESLLAQSRPISAMPLGISVSLLLALIC